MPPDQSPDTPVQEEGLLSATTFLLDLDNTLLGNDIHEFLPPYFASLEERLHPFIDNKNLRQMMIDSVQAALANQDPTVTNMSAFMADFTRRIGYSAEVLQPMMDRFYQEDYPQLQQYTTCWPEARPVVRRLFADGYKVVIATNPLFPATAIEQRLQWAGINDFPFAWVTTIENSHFSKPHPRYYEEILSRVNSTPQEAWMVGDDPKNDIAPARSLGLKTWWMTNTTKTIEAKERPVCDRQGTLAEFLAWVESGRVSA
jgi:HAD superfamily hydrolase (TIGR01662 family)